MHRYIIGITSFLVSWNVLYYFYEKIAFPFLFNLPGLLILFGVSMVLAQKCVNYLGRVDKKRYAQLYVGIVFIGIVGVISWHGLSYRPKSFSQVIGMNEKVIKQVSCDVRRHETYVLSDTEQMQNLIAYLSSFTYEKKRGATGQDSLAALLFERDNNKQAYLNIRSTEVWTMKEVFDVREGMIEEAILYEILGIEWE